MEPYSPALRNAHLHQLILAASLALFWPQTGAAETSTTSRVCAGQDITVTAPEPGLQNLVCKVANDHAARLATCDVHQLHPISVSIVPKILDMPENCVGAFHCKTNKIEIVLPQTFAARDAPRSIYRGLAPEAAFDSVLRHELTHAFLEQATEGHPISDAAHEYIAFAFQIDAMSDKDRAVFLETNGQRPARSLDTFNMYIYSLLPGQFAGAAWLHFNTQGNGCVFINRILTGDVVLGSPRLNEP